MATRPTAGIVRGWQVLDLLAAAPESERTVKGLAARSNSELSADQVEGALLAFLEVGVVSRRQTDSGQVYFLLGSQHLHLALREMDGLLLGSVAELRELLHRAEGLKSIGLLLNALRGAA